MLRQKNGLSTPVRNGTGQQQRLISSLSSSKKEKGTFGGRSSVSAASPNQTTIPTSTTTEIKAKVIKEVDPEIVSSATPASTPQAHYLKKTRSPASHRRSTRNKAMLA